MQKNNFTTNLIFSKDPLAEVKLEQVFEYILNINNQKQDEEQTDFPKKNQGHQSCQPLKAQKA